MADKDRVTLTANTSEIEWSGDGLRAPTIFAEDIRGAMSNPSVTKFNLIEYRMDVLSDTLKAVHVATLVVPTDKVAAFGNYLTRVVEPSDTPEAGEAGTDAKA